MIKLTQEQRQAATDACDDLIASAKAIKAAWDGGQIQELPVVIDHARKKLDTIECATAANVWELMRDGRISITVKRVQS